MIFNIIYSAPSGKKSVFSVKIGGVPVTVKVGNITIEKVIIMIIKSYEIKKNKDNCNCKKYKNSLISTFRPAWYQIINF